MESLITVMNKLQDVFSTIGSSHKIDLPQIVVVGSQSSGKSSVLESLVGKTFLPRGTGIVTRAPLILHLINASDIKIENNHSNKSKDWATFLHKPNVNFYDFCKVRKEIELKTEELAGGKKNITDEPIVLNIYSKSLYNLSFVDLPGLTKVPVGDQPIDIEEKIRNMVLRFIQNPNSIILAVVTANTDPATSESLHIAKSVDPNGDRTIAVVTKIDIMDAGTDARELLSGEVIPVKLGIIGVMNRSQQDINENKSIEQSLEAEAKFFQKVYPSVADQQGTTFLGKKLQYLLIAKIKETCPELKKQLYEMSMKYTEQEREVKEFTDNYDRSLLDLITQTARSYKACLDGEANNRSMEDLNGGANIANYFKKTFNKDIEEINPLSNLSTKAITNIINNASGTSMGVFMPAQAFDHLVKKQIKQLEGPSMNCVNFVHNELLSNIYHLDIDISRELKKYPNLQSIIIEILQDLLVKFKRKTSEAVSQLIRYQESFINTSHPDFIEAVISSDEYHALFNKVKKAGDQDGFGELCTDVKKCSLLSMRKTVEKLTTCVFAAFADTEDLILESRVGLLSLFIQCYYKVVKKIIQDTVPKIIVCEMVNQMKLNFQKTLISKVYKSKDLKMAELLQESKEIMDERIKIHNRFVASEKALKLMREIEQICYVNDN